MSRSSLALLAILTFIPAAGAATPIALLDACAHESRASHVESCEKNKWSCLQDVGPSSRRTHEITHCAITFSQCMSRGAAASAIH